MPISDAELSALVGQEIKDAELYIDGVIGSQRAESLKYYRGEKLGTEEEGRSQVVTREVAAAVHSMLPSLMKVFFGSEKAVEFVPTNQEDVQAAEQATDYVNYVILQDNPGFEVFHTAFKDSLYQKAGVVKYWLDESIEVTYHDFTNWTDESLGLVLDDPGVELVEVTSRFADDALEIALMAGVEPPQLHDGSFKRVTTSPRIRIDAMPPEEFLIDRRAKSVDTARYVGHRTLKSVRELVAMGYERDFLLKHTSVNDSLQMSHETTARFTASAGWPSDTKNEEERPVLYVESYIYTDYDADGFAELRRICTIGEDHEIVANDPVDRRPFVDFCPDPEPHLFFGQDLADQTKDLQKINTSVFRHTLDSLALSIYPRMAVVEGQVNMDDVLNTEIGAVVREYQPGAVRPLVVPFVGKEALPIMEMIDREKDRRVGTHNLALEADALQSTTKAAVNAQVDAATQHLELVARIYAESGMKRLFKGLLRLIVEHQDRPRMVRLRNEYVEVDPRSWNANMDVTVNVGLGHGLQEDRLASLREIAQYQQAVMGALGPNNPAVTLGQATNTIAKIAELSGWKDTAQFVTPLPADFQLPMPEPKPSPEEVLAQVEMLKKQADMQIEAAELSLDQDKFLADVLLRAEQIQAQSEGYTVDIERLKDTIAADRIARSTR